MRLFKRKKSANSVSRTKIKRKVEIEGISIPGIIFNLDYHIIDLKVYSDGIIDCWEMVDLPIFQEKLKENWVVTSIPEGSQISIFELGRWKIKNCKWNFDRQSYFDFVKSLVKVLNPNMENLYNMHGSTSMKVNGVNTSKLGFSSPEPYYVSSEIGVHKETIEGNKFTIFFRDEDDQFYLSQMSIFKDGLVHFNDIPNSKSYKFADIRKLIDSKKILSEIPTGNRVNLGNLGSFELDTGYSIDIEEKFLDFQDQFNALQGKEDCLSKCIRIFEEFMERPTATKKEELKISFESIPKHKRMYVGDMDTQDFHLKLILYGESARQEWEERYRHPMPDFKVPELLD